MPLGHDFVADDGCIGISAILIYTQKDASHILGALSIP
jgi:hypothetical protein